MLILHLGCADDIRPGCINMDPVIDGWRFEDGLPMFSGESVDGITISHAIQNVRRSDRPSVFREFHRVLKRDGVLRITDDDTESPDSPRYMKPVSFQGSPVEQTGPRQLCDVMHESGFRLAMVQKADTTLFPTRALLIAHREHKVPRYVFYVEGQK